MKYAKLPWESNLRSLEFLEENMLLINCWINLEHQEKTCNLQQNIDWSHDLEGESKLGLTLDNW